PLSLSSVFISTRSFCFYLCPYPTLTLFPYTTLFRSRADFLDRLNEDQHRRAEQQDRNARGGQRLRLAMTRDVRHRADARPRPRQDRKSTRLNSSHQIISYAVFCLKKKKKTQKLIQQA